MSGAGLVAMACCVVVAVASAAPAAGGRHFPHFSLLGERVAVKKLPRETRFAIGGPPGAKGFGLLPHVGRGPVWFGQVERPNATIEAVGKGHWVCQFERPHDELGGGGGACTTVAGARELGLLDVRSCGKGPPRHFRIHGLVPDGVTGLEVERSDGTIGRTVTVIENTVAFTIGREDFKLHGVGDAAAEGLERTLPLAHVGGDGGRADCSFYTFVEARS